jgi:hypothetical protein
VAAAVAWGTLRVDGVRVGLRAAPFAGRWEWHGSLRLLPAVAIATAAVAQGPRVAARLRWRWVPLATGVGAAVWATALAVGDGWSRLTEPLTSRHEYEPLAGRIQDLPGFLQTYVDRLSDHPIHVQGHPPGPLVVAWLLDRVGLGGAGWLAALAIAGWGVAAGAAVVAARAMAGEAATRRAAPALVLLPAAVWAGTSLDALFAGVTALAVALAAVAVRRGQGPLMPAAGFAAGAALLLSYGATVLLLIPVGLVLLARRPAALLRAWVVGLAVPLATAARAGFWWLDGLEATRAAYWAGIASRRPGVYLTLLGDPAVLAVAVGPAVVVALAQLVASQISAGGAGLRRLSPKFREELPALPPLLPLLALTTVVLADLSQYARGEVERIWLPFVPWLALAAPADRRAWLAVQAGVALLVQSFLVSPW